MNLQTHEGGKALSLSTMCCPEFVLEKLLLQILS